MKEMIESGVEYAKEIEKMPVKPEANEEMMVMLDERNKGLDTKDIKDMEIMRDVKDMGVKEPMVAVKDDDFGDYNRKDFGL